MYFFLMANAQLILKSSKIYLFCWNNHFKHSNYDILAKTVFTMLKW